MLIPPYAEGNNPETGMHEIIVSDILPDPSEGDIHVEFTFDARLPKDYLGECLQLCFIDSDSEFPLLDVLLTELPEGVREIIMSGREVAIKDATRNIEIPCRLQHLVEA